METDIRKTLEELEIKPTIGEIIKCSPYDSARNLNGFLTEEIFFNNLFVGEKIFISLKKELCKSLTSIVDVNNVLVLSGFSGVGKTTFMRYVKLKADEYKSEFIDFHSTPILHDKTIETSVITKKIKKAIDLLLSIESSDKNFNDTRREVNDLLVNTEKKLETIGEQNSPIISSLKTHLTGENLDHLISTISCIKENMSIFAKYLSKKLIEIIIGYEIDDIRDNYTEIILNANLIDTFTLFFLCCFEKYDTKDRVLLVFDNMDTIEMDHLSEYFHDTIHNVLNNIHKLSQEDIYNNIQFKNRYKIIYCLRDANAEVLNVHIKASVDNGEKITIKYNTNIYKDIINRRIEYYTKNILKGQEIIERNISRARIIIEQIIIDNYFNTTIVNLVNSDYRKLSNSLINITLNQKILPKDELLIKLENIENANAHDKHMLRGLLVYAFTDILKKNDYLNAYPYFDSRTKDKKLGQCSPTRLLLTMLINMCVLDRNIHLYDMSRNVESIKLVKVIKEADGVLTVEQILNIVAEAFLFHEKNWVHLVTIRNCAVTKNGAFDSILKIIKRRNIDNYNTLEDNKDIFDILESINLIINPSGIIFIKSIIVHFEYYANIANNPIPLYTCGINESKSNLYEFEIIIDRVYKLVEEEVEMMTKYYNNVFVKKLNYDEDIFKKSKYAFKHPGKGEYRYNGQFHSIRIITSHIDYLDNFRLALVKKIKDDKIKSKINRKIVKRIEKYVELLNKTPDKITSKNFYLKYNYKIEKIVKSKYLDTKIIIRERF